MKLLHAGRGFLACFSISVILFSCNENDKLDIEKSAAAFDIRQGEASIKRSNQNFMNAFEANDSVGVANCFTTDAKAMVPNMPSIKGRDNILHFISKRMDSGMVHVELNTIKIWGDSSILIEEGTYRASDSTENELDEGKYIVLWAMEAGNWKRYRDIWTSNLPVVPDADLTEKKPVPAK